MSSVLAALQNQKLRELIRSVRACKTAAEERAVIAKECASIRTSLKEGNEFLRARNVAKLMYIHMLGYPTQFGQMECINLITSERYAEKRVGYLGLMVLLDEKQEVITLIENHLKKDLQDQNQYVQGLALAAVANISSEDMSRGLSSEILNLLNSANPYIRKKAALCALRIIRKVQTGDVVDMYLDYFAANLLNERNHGVLVSSIALVIEGLQSKHGAKSLPVYRQLVPVAVRMLKNLVMSSYAMEQDINGVADPFLQVKLLQLLRVLGAGDRKSCDHMNDVLAQVATNTESSKNCGNAILYECVITILAMDADPGLRVLAVNILGRFLVNRDNNIRYVALNTLTQVVSKDLQAVQRHKNTIVDCLKDVDISIRRRALDLTYALVNSSNVRLLVPDLINYLSFANNDFKEDLTTKICFVVERYAPSKQWHIDTLIKVLTLAGYYVSETAGNKLLVLISQSEPTLQAYCVKVLWGVMANNAPIQNGTATLEGSEEDAAAYCKKETLLVVTLWCVGEYCNLLCEEVAAGLTLSESSGQDWQKHQPSPHQVINVLAALLQSHYVTSSLIHQHSMTTLLKLAGNFSEVRESCKSLLQKFMTNRDLEVQQRACEFSTLIGHLDACPGLTDKMPPIEVGQTEGASPSETVAFASASDATSSSGIAKPAAPAATNAPAPKAPAVSQNTLDLDDVFSAPPAVANTASPDFLDDIFGPSPTTPQPAAIPPTVPQPAPVQSASAIDDILSAPLPPAPAPVPVAAPTPAVQGANINVFRKEGEISIDFQCTKGPGTTSHITAVIYNISPGLLYNFSFQAAVPKYAKLQIMPLSDTSVQPGGSIKTTMVVDNPSEPHKAVMMRLRPKYTNVANIPTEEDIKVANLPDWV